MAIDNINQGEIFNIKNIWVKRPGTGPLKAEYFSSVIGKTSLREIKKDEFIKRTDFK